MRRRLEELEEKYKDLNHQQRAQKINEELLNNFCVGVREIRIWKRVIKTADRLKGENVFTPEKIAPMTLHEIAKLPEQKQLEVAKKVAEKNLTVKQTKKLVRAVLEKERPPLPTEPFNVIYADPPWTYNVKHLRGSPENHYPTMTIEEIAAIPVPSDENALLFLWTTNPMLEDALKVMAAWGFKYKTNMVWVKNRMGVGFYFRGQHELLLLGVKGNVHAPQQTNRFSSVLESRVRNHSQKPREAYEIIEKMYPEAKFLELFARERRERWESWGNEL